MTAVGLTSERKPYGSPEAVRQEDTEDKVREAAQQAGTKNAVGLRLGSDLSAFQPYVSPATRNVERPADLFPTPKPPQIARSRSADEPNGLVARKDGRPILPGDPPGDCKWGAQPSRKRPSPDASSRAIGNASDIAGASRQILAYAQAAACNMQCGRWAVTADSAVFASLREGGVGAPPLGAVYLGPSRVTLHEPQRLRGNKEADLGETMTPATAAQLLKNYQQRQWPGVEADHDIFNAMQKKTGEVLPTFKRRSGGLTQ